MCDPYGGITVFQWSNAAADLGQDAARPLPPAADEVVGTAAKYLVQVVAGLPRSVTDLEQQCRYDEEVSRLAGRQRASKTNPATRTHTTTRCRSWQPQLVL